MQTVNRFAKPQYRDSWLLWFMLKGDVGKAYMVVVLCPDRRSAGQSLNNPTRKTWRFARSLSLGQGVDTVLSSHLQRRQGHQRQRHRRQRNILGVRRSGGGAGRGPRTVAAISSRRVIGRVLYLMNESRSRRLYRVTERVIVITFR